MSAIKAFDCIYRQEIQENGGKAITLISKTTTLFISLPSLYDSDVKLPNFTFYGGRGQKTGIFFSSSELR